MNAKRENNYITPDPATLRQSSNSHNMNGSISIPCSLMMTTVCPHPECNGYERMCSLWETHSSK